MSAGKVNATGHDDPYLIALVTQYCSSCYFAATGRFNPPGTYECLNGQLKPLLMAAHAAGSTAHTKHRAHRVVTKRNMSILKIPEAKHRIYGHRG